MRNERLGDTFRLITRCDNTKRRNRERDKINNKQRKKDSYVKELVSHD